MNKFNFLLQLIIFVSGSKLFSRIRDRNKNPDPCTVHVFLSKPNAAKVRSVTKIAKSSFQIWIKISRQHGLLSPLPPKKNPRKIALLPARFAKASLTWKCWQSICWGCRESPCSPRVAGGPGRAGRRWIRTGATQRTAAHRPEYGCTAAGTVWNMDEMWGGGLIERWANLLLWH